MTGHPASALRSTPCGLSGPVFSLSVIGSFRGAVTADRVGTVEQAGQVPQ